MKALTWRFTFLVLAAVAVSTWLLAYTPGVVANDSARLEMLKEVYLGTKYKMSDGSAPKFSYTVADNPPRLIWSDGREATVFAGYNTSDLFVDIKVSVESNSCRVINRTMCEMRIPFVAAFYELRWTKNPDPQRLNQIVQAQSTITRVDAPKGGWPFFDMAFTDISDTDDRFLVGGPKMAKQVPDLKLRCKDYSWLSATNASELTIANWQIERNVSNRETDANENALQESVRGVKMKFVADHYEIGDADALVGTADYHPLFEKAVVWAIREGNDFCSVRLGFEIPDSINFEQMTKAAKRSMSLYDWTIDDGLLNAHADKALRMLHFYDYESEPDPASKNGNYRAAFRERNAK